MKSSDSDVSCHMLGFEQSKGIPLGGGITSDDIWILDCLAWRLKIGAGGLGCRGVFQLILPHLRSQFGFGLFRLKIF